VRRLGAQKRERAGGGAYAAAVAGGSGEGANTGVVPGKSYGLFLNKFWVSWNREHIPRSWLSITRERQNGRVTGRRRRKKERNGTATNYGHLACAFSNT
jgi:hypothetical protein